MEQWKRDSRREPVITDLETLVPEGHLLRKIEKVMDYDWLYERLDPYYCHDSGRPGTDPVVLVLPARCCFQKKLWTSGFAYYSKVYFCGTYI